MAFSIIRNDITKVTADAIINPANPQPVIGRGTDTSVYKAAGMTDLLAARQKIGAIEPGRSVWTESFHLSKRGVKYIIHTAGICYGDGSRGEEDILRSCYSTSLKMAVELKCKSVAIPLLATGSYGFPKELGFRVAVDEINAFLLDHDMDVILVVYDKESHLISEKLFNDVQDFLDVNLEDDYVEDSFTVYKVHSGRFSQEFECIQSVLEDSDEWYEDFFDSDDDDSFEADFEQTGSLTENVTASNKEDKKDKNHKKQNDDLSVLFSGVQYVCADNLEVHVNTRKSTTTERHSVTGSNCSKAAIDDFISISGQSLNFQNTLQQLIAERNLENKTVYRKAFMDRKHFSKIISNKNYVPKKTAVMALGLALNLELEEFESFLKSAGYALMPSSRFDMIVKYFVVNSNYNMAEINMTLNDYGQPCFVMD